MPESDLCVGWFAIYLVKLVHYRNANFMIIVKNDAMMTIFIMVLEHAPDTGIRWIWDAE